jgi:GntR family transcriptional regulator, histidine utilization repressor
MNDRTKASTVAPSLHQRILGDIEQNILTGAWPPGHRVPSEIALTEQYQCSRMTVSKVLAQLARAGLIVRRRKTGSFVLPQRTHSAILEISDVKDEVKALGLPYRYQILARRIRPISKDEEAGSQPSKRQQMLDVECLHLADGQPFCLEERSIHLAAVPDAAEEEFKTLSPGAWLLNHVPWTAAEHRIAAIEASETAAKNLAMAEGAPCLAIERRTWRAGEPVTFARLTYPGHKWTLTAHFIPSQN